MPFKKFNEFLNEQKKNKKTKKSDKKALGSVGDKSLVYQPKVHKYDKIKDKGLGNVGDEKNIYEPDTGPELQKKAPEWHKTNIKEWLNKTKKLSVSEFAKKIHEEKKVKININNKINNAEDLIESFVETLKSNPKLIEVASREFNRSGLLEGFISELSKIRRSKKIHESISEPVGFEGESEEEDSMGQEEDEEGMEGDEDIDMGDEGDEEDMGDEGDEEDMGDEEVEEDEDGKIHHHHHHHHHHHNKGDEEDEFGEEEDEEDLDSDDLEDHGYNKNQDMEDDSPLGRKSGGRRDYFSDEM